MEKFIGTKIIMAEPCERDGLPGYNVMYHDVNGIFDGDSYTSWSPAGVFEQAYRRIDNCTFGIAIEAMKLGEKVKLPKWQDDVFISIQTPDANSKMTASYFYVTSRFGMVPWIPTMIEMLSEEWTIVD